MLFIGGGLRTTYRNTYKLPWGAGMTTLALARLFGSSEKRWIKFWCFGWFYWFYYCRWKLGERQNNLQIECITSRKTWVSVPFFCWGVFIVQPVVSSLYNISDGGCCCCWFWLRIRGMNYKWSFELCSWCLLFADLLSHFWIVFFDYFVNGKASFEGCTICDYFFIYFRYSLN